MEKLTIYVPERKSALVKELLKELGVSIQMEKMDMEAHLKEIAEIPVWSDEELKAFEETTKHFNSFKPQEW